MAWVLREESQKGMPNIEAYVHSTVPMGSGVSSSAALELAFGVLWNALANLGIDNASAYSVARLQVRETSSVGVILRDHGP